MRVLENELGKTISAERLANFLEMDVNTVRKHYAELGGMRLGRQYLFFERRVINAIQKRTEVDSPSAEGWDETGEGVSDEEGSCIVGSQNEAKIRQRVEQEDRHDLLD